MKKLLLYFSTLAVFLMCNSHVDAINFSASLTPPLQHILMKQGATGNTTLRLHNTGDPVTLQLKIVKTEPENESFTFTELKESMVSFTDASVKNPFIMTTNEVKNVELDIKTTGNILGDQYFAVIAETVPQPGQEGKTTVHLKGSVSSFVLVSVRNNADIDQTPSIVLFDTKPMFRLNFFGKKLNIFDTSQPIPLILTVQNQGENAFQAEGWISLNGSSDKSSNFPLAARYLLVDSQVTLTSPLSKSPNELVLPAQKIGKYNLKATITAGKQGKGVTANASFIVLPVRIAGIVSIIVLIIPILLIFYIRKKQN